MTLILVVQADGIAAVRHRPDPLLRTDVLARPALPLASMTPAELALYAAHLRSTVEFFGVLTDPQVTPRPGSPADHELAEARMLSLGDGIWGEDRVRTVYAAALMSYTAALDEAVAMAAVITAGVRTAIPAVVLSRSIAELCAQAWWLLEPGLGARGRVERLQCLRMRSAIEGERAAEANGIDEADWHEYTETQAQVREYSRKLGLDEPRREKRHRPPPLGRQIHPRQDRQAGHPPEHHGPGPPAGPREPWLGIPPDPRRASRPGSEGGGIDRVANPEECRDRPHIPPATPRDTADALLEAVGIVTPPVRIREVVNGCAVQILPWGFDEHIDGLVVELDGGSVIWVNEAQVPARQRFTLAHELGHHLLRHADAFHLDLGGDLAPNVTGGHPGYDWRAERAANEFAANLLMPAPMVRKAATSTTDVVTLASCFRVSAAAMGFRLKALRIA
jgi:IrrE N-terminal-like domain